MSIKEKYIAGYELLRYVESITVPAVGGFLRNYPDGTLC
jgi:hypothetical protein